MKFVLAFDSFKGSLDALAVVEAVRRGITRVLPDADFVMAPLADGGEGTVLLLTQATGGQIRTSTVHGPLTDPVNAQWGMVERTKTAILEVAETSGLILIEADMRDPTRTTSYGVGELMKSALDAGAQHIIIGLGGSATTDGGAGMAEALGVRFVGCDHPMTGGSLLDIESVDVSGIDERIRETSIRVALDVNNPLLGSRGAARVFAPQKGATSVQVEILEEGLCHLASFIPTVAPDLTGAAAAGGLGWGLAAFCGAELMSGIDLCLDTIGFDEQLSGADVVLTGEGLFDRQSFEGKVPLGVARRAEAFGIPTVVLAGDHEGDLSSAAKSGIVSYHSICGEFNVTVEHAIAHAAELLEDLAATIVPDLIEKRADQ